MEPFKFKNRERVTVHSLGDNKLYRAIIVGVSAQYPGPGGTFYIIKSVDSFRPTYQYDCVTIPEGCLRLGWPGTKRYLGGMLLDRLEKQ